MENSIWFPFSDEPVIESHWYVPSFSGPSVILPLQSPDGKWHIFLHSWLGVHHFVSDSGIAWEPKRLVVARGHYPFVFIDNGKYHLVYENHEIDNISDAIKCFGRRKNTSKIEIISSDNLVNWSSPRTLLSADKVPYSVDYTGRFCLSAPQLIKKRDGSYRLYFNAADILLPDSRQTAPKFFGFSESDSLEKEFTAPEDSLLLEAEPDNPYLNISPGIVKIVPYYDTVYAIACSYYWDEDKRKTSGAVLLLKGEDGLSFTPALDKPIFSPQNDGWASSFIRTCDVKFKAEESCWYLYFSATGDKKDVLGLWKRESVGLFIGDLPKQ